MKKTILLPLLVIAAAILIYLLYPRTYKYETSFYDVFDTYSTLTIYSKSDEEAQAAMDGVHEELIRLNQLYDIYNSYEGINNIKTINDNAGVAPVEVDEDIMELLKFAKEAYYDTDGAVNPMMGAVLSIWHDHRTAALDNPEKASLPDMNELKEASKHTDISLLVLDEENSTVYIADSEASLDVGAVAKGFAADKAVAVLRDMGIDSALINLGGNVCAIGRQSSGKPWNIGVTNPENTTESSAVITAEDISVVTSGSYQRYFEVEGKRYNHIIDGDTLMPAERYASVTVTAESSAVADMLSTALFILPEDEGDKLADKYGAGVCRIYDDGTISADKMFTIR